MAKAEIEVSAQDVLDVIPKIDAFMKTLPKAQAAVVGLLSTGAHLGVHADSDVKLFAVGAKANIGAGVDLTDVTGGLSKLLGSVELTATDTAGLALHLVGHAAGAGLGTAAKLGGTVHTLAGGAANAAAHISLNI